MRTETFDNAADFMAAVQGKPRATRGRNTRPDIPSAGRAPRTGLSTFIKAGWSIEFRVGAGCRLYVINTPALDTGYHPSEQAACDAARGLG